VILNTLRPYSGKGDVFVPVKAGLISSPISNYDTFPVHNPLEEKPGSETQLGKLQLRLPSRCTVRDGTAVTMLKGNV